MRPGKKLAMLFAAVALGGSVAGIGTASAHSAHATGNYTDHLKPVPHDPAASNYSNVRGRAFLHYNSDTHELNVFVSAHGLSPNLPHLVHIHGDIQAQNECPGPDARARRVDDGLIDTVEGLPDYGPIQVTFSTSGGTGDMTSKDALDLSRAPVSDNEGNLYYARSFPVSEQVGANLDHLHVVIHGLDLNENGAYDGPAGSLGPDVPLEAELPVSCGPLEAASGHGWANWFNHN